MYGLDDNFFWNTLEVAWLRFETSLAGRLRPGQCFRDDVFDGEVMDPNATMAGFCTTLKGMLDGPYPKEALAAFLREFERKLFLLDNERLAARLRISGDDFLAARTFLVLMGKRYFDRVIADWRQAPLDITLLRGTHAALQSGYEARFGEPYVGSGLCVATGSNREGWLDLFGLDAVAQRLLTELGLKHPSPPSSGPVVFPKLDTGDLQELLLVMADCVREDIRVAVEEGERRQARG